MNTRFGQIIVVITGVKILAKESHNYKLLIKEPSKYRHNNYDFNSLKRNVGSL